MKLRNFTKDDAPMIAEWLKLDKIQKTFCGEEFEPTKPWMLYLICQDDGEPVGAITLFNIEWDEKAEIGIAFVKPAFNKSLVSELFKFTSCAFNVYNLKQIYAHHNGPKAEKFAAFFGFDKGVLKRNEFFRRCFEWE